MRNKSVKPSCLFQSASSIRGVTRPHGPAIRKQEETSSGTKREECHVRGSLVRRVRAVCGETGGR